MNPALSILTRALLLATLGSLASIAKADEVADATSPNWQAAMTHHVINGHPDWPDVLQPDGIFNTQIWPAMEYWVYVPPLATTKRSPSLVVYLHGTDQTPVDAALGTRWNELADRRGFVVVYPQGENNSWGWGASTGYGRGHGELEAVARITRQVERDFDTNPQRTYVAGASSGAVSATMLGALYADHYRALMSALGCSYSCVDPTGVLAYAAMGENAKVVPAFNVHGTLDPVFSPVLAAQADTQAVGTNDLADNGLPDASVWPLPQIDALQLDASPGNYPYEIHRYRDDYGPGRTIVESWWIHGLGHAYPYGDPAGSFTDPMGPDITTAAFDFFESVNLPPSAVDDAASTAAGTPVTIAVLRNDRDADGDRLTISAVSTPARGRVVIRGGKLRYLPRPRFKGIDSFSYTTDDGHGGRAVAQVTVRVGTLP